MVNQQFDRSNESYWYPQLPDGYSNPEQSRHHQAVPMPLPYYHQSPYGQPSYQPFSQAGQNRIPGFPPFGGNFPTSPPWSWQGGGGFPSPQQPNMNQPPQSPPPNWTPEYPEIQPRAVDPGAISGCMFRFTYVWLSRRQGFWFFPVFVGPRSVAGYRWNARRHRWEYFGLDLNQINSFTCV